MVNRRKPACILKWLSLYMEISDKWCASRISAGLDFFIIFILFLIFRPFRHLPYHKRLEAFDLWSPEERRNQADLLEAF